MSMIVLSSLNSQVAAASYSMLFVCTWLCVYIYITIIDLNLITLNTCLFRSELQDIIRLYAWVSLHTHLSSTTLSKLLSPYLQAFTKPGFVYRSIKNEIFVLWIIHKFHFTVVLGCWRSHQSRNKTFQSFFRISQQTKSVNLNSISMVVKFNLNYMTQSSVKDRVIFPKYPYKSVET